MSCRSLGHPCSRVLYASCVLFGLLKALEAQQTSEKLVKAIQAEQITDAVLISNIAVAGNTVECGLFIKPPLVFQPVTPFQAGGDWLRHMTISLINRTNKTIVFGAIIFHFLDTGDCSGAQPSVGVSIDLGQMPGIDAYDGRTGRPLKPEHPERPSLDWKPEKPLVVHVSDYIDDFEGSLSDFMPVTAITKVNIYRGPFYLADGMQWNLGRYSVPDPSRRGKFKELPADYFPGRKGEQLASGIQPVSEARRPCDC